MHVFSFFFNSVSNTEKGMIVTCDLVDLGVQDCSGVHSWLDSLQLTEYIPLFTGAGYDMPTISRMTPEVGLAFLQQDLFQRSTYGLEMSWM